LLELVAFLAFAAVALAAEMNTVLQISLYVLLLAAVIASCFRPLDRKDIHYGFVSVAVSCARCCASIFSRHDFPYRISTQTASVATTRNRAEIVENQPTPIFSIAGRHTAVPKAPKRYRTM